MLRLILGVIVGYAVFALSAVLLFRLSQQGTYAAATPAFMTGGIIYGVFFGMLAGYVAAGIARRRIAAVAVAIVIVLGAVMSLVFRPAGAAVWSQFAALLLMAPAAALGGTVGRRPKPPATEN